MKNRQAISLLFAANSISGFAQGISIIAIPWYFNNVLGLPSVFGTVNLMVTSISLMWGLYAGTLIDRCNRKKIFIITSAAGFVILTSISLSGFYLMSLPAVLVSLVYATTFFVYNIHYPALFAFAQEITEPKDYGRIISWIEIQGQATTALAMAVGAILYKGTADGCINLFGFPVTVGMNIRPWHLHEIFLMDGITYLIAIFLIAKIRYNPSSFLTAEVTATVWERLKTGYDFLKKHSLVFLFGNASFFIFATVIVTGFQLFPTYIQNHLRGEADVFATFEMYFALGSMVAGMAVRRLFQRTNTVMAVILMTLVTSAIYFLCMAPISLLVFYVIGLLQGFCNAGTRVMRMTFLFHHIPNSLIGRTGGVFMMANVLFRLLFFYLLSRPFFVTGDNVIYSFGILAVFVLVSAMLMLVNYKRLVEMPEMPHPFPFSKGEGSQN
ncbi:MAG TPA: MFS transporter [Chitinophagales bacterium]|nr:MFS transporter [Chitinophagales bacterium]